MSVDIPEYLERCNPNYSEQKKVPSTDARFSGNRDNGLERWMKNFPVI